MSRTGAAACLVAGLVTTACADASLAPAGPDAADPEVTTLQLRTPLYAPAPHQLHLPVFATRDGDEEVATSVTATGAMRAALQALLHDACGAP